ncbi:OapA family protein [Brenneria izadpanahii]|uniref:OapA family protein n=1 Tax=Brenneria izadpanahii TaxID=2722756 RepID=UPI001FEAEEC6|nr:LysM-like peptidoglycan-binding domain-containing protein [Brenneria izadpanahii]
MQSSSSQRIKAALKKIWHLPDSYRWMEPLPLFHRRWMLVAAGIVLVALLWPYSPPPAPSPQPTPVTVEPAAPMQAEIVENRPPATQTPAARPAPPPIEPAPQHTETAWRNYQISSGQTLAQLFRDNNLPVADVFAMAQVEGEDKPLSNLRAGQEVKLQLNAQGAVAELEIETTGNQMVRFTRNADGGFTRSR